jgi:hypothetical protein
MIRRHQSPRHLRHRRAVEFIEFAILLPFLIFFTTFAIDMGRITMLQAALQDGVQQVARGGAQSGGWDFVNANYCAGPAGQCAVGSEPFDILENTISNTPFGYTLTSPTLSSYASEDGTTYGGTECENNTNTYIVARASYSAKDVFITPGLYTLLGVAINNYKWTLNANAVARADVCYGTAGSGS